MAEVPELAACKLLCGGERIDVARRAAQGELSRLIELARFRALELTARGFWQDAGTEQHDVVHGESERLLNRAPNLALERGLGGFVGHRRLESDDDPLAVVVRFHGSEG